MGRVDVEFDREPLRLPVGVELVSLDQGVHLRPRQPSGEGEVAEALLEVGAQRRGLRLVCVERGGELGCCLDARRDARGALRRGAGRAARRRPRSAGTGRDPATTCPGARSSTVRPGEVTGMPSTMVTSSVSSRAKWTTPRSLRWRRVGAVRWKVPGRVPRSPPDPRRRDVAGDGWPVGEHGCPGVVPAN